MCVCVCVFGRSCMSVYRSRRSTAHGTIEIARGDAVCERGSIFTAQVAWPVKTVAAANAAIALMRQETVATSADHNMTAYRIGGHKKSGSGNKSSSKIEKAYDDDGEANLGQRLLGCLTKQGACDVAVMVSRVYGGENIGKRRFEIVCERAATLLQLVGHVPGVGISHDWGGGGIVLGGGGGGSGSGSSTSACAASSRLSGSSTGKKRKSSASSAADEEFQRRVAQREAMAQAAERRAQMAAAAASSSTAG